MRLAIFTSGVYPFFAHGAEIGIYYLARELALRNNEVSLYISELTPNRATPKILGLPRGMKIIFSPGIRLRFIYNLSYLFASLYRLSKSSEKPTLIVVNVPTLLSLMNAYLARLILRAPYVAIIHGPPDLDARSSLVHTLQCFLIRRAACVVCVSRNLRQMVVRSCQAEEPLFDVIPNGYDEREVAQLVSDSKRGISGRELAFVGTLDENKDPITAIRGFQHVSSRVPDVVMNIVGQGPLENKALELIDQEKLQNSVRIYDAMEHLDLLRILSHCTLLIVSSHREGMPTVVIEALAMGKPVVATQVGGLPEIITSGENGFLVPVGDSESLALSVERILTEPGLWEKLSRGARQSTLVYTWTRITARYEVLFGSIIKTHSQS